MFLVGSRQERELWNFCKDEFKNDAEFAYSQYMERKNDKKLRLLDKSLGFISLRKAPF